MERPQLSYSKKKFIRLQKANIRASVLDVAKQDSMIADMYKKLSEKPVVVPEVKKEANKKEAKVAKETKATKVKKVK